MSATPSPPDDSVRRAVLAARSEAVLVRRLRDAWSAAGFPEPPALTARILQTHYRPCDRARLVVEISAPAKSGVARQLLSIQIYATADAARRRAATSVADRTWKCLGPPVSLIEPWNAVVWALPNGPRLRAMRIGFRRRLFKHFMRQCDLIGPKEKLPADAKLPELIRYVPRRRGLFRYDLTVGRGLGPVYIKCYAGRDDDRAAENLEILHGASAGRAPAFDVPALVAHHRRRHAVVMSGLPGVTLSSVVPTSDPAPWRAAGAALAALHGLDCAVRRSWTPGAELRALAAAVADLTRADPALTERLASLYDLLERRAARLDFEAERGVTHGNMFGDQILVDGSRIGIVDWDDLCMGDPLYDLGRLVAHAWHRFGTTLESNGSAALIDGYRVAGGRIHAARLRWHVATALVLRAKISSLRTLVPGWMDEVRSAVGRAQALIDTEVDDLADLLAAPGSPATRRRWTA